MSMPTVGGTPLQETMDDSVPSKPGLTPQQTLAATAHDKLGGAIGPAEEAWLKLPETLTVYATLSGSKADREHALCCTLRWRIEQRALLSSLVCSYCAANSRSHDCRIFGADPEGDVVLMNCFALPEELSPAGVTEHLTCVLERALKAYPGTADRPGLFTWVVDIHGFGLLSRHADPRTSISLLKLLKVAFKGRLKRIVVLSAPTSFWATWGAVRTVVDEETDKCIEFLDWPQAPERFRALFGESLAANMLREAEENRDPAQAATKKWQTFYGAEAKQLAGAKA